MISYSAVLLHSCTCADYQTLQYIKSTSCTANSVSYTLLANDKALFKADIALYDKQLSGLLFIKKIRSQYRALFVTEIGMKIFDIELTDKAFIVHYSIEALQNHYTMQTIAKDLKLLLLYTIREKECSLLQDPYNRYVFRIPDKRDRIYLFVDKSTSRLIRIEYSSAAFKTVTITISDYSGNIPALINIDHHNIELKIKLKKLLRQY